MASKKHIKLFVRFLIILGISLTCTKSFRLKLTKVQCESLDESVVTIIVCRVKAVSRNVQYLSLDFKVHDAPVTAFTGQYSLMKRANGYRPFLYNVTANCYTIQRVNPLTRIIKTWYKNLTNVNTSCPFNVSNLRMPRLENTRVVGSLDRLPVPLGDYALYTEFSLNNKSAYTVKVYATVY